MRGGEEEQRRGRRDAGRLKCELAVRMSQARQRALTGGGVGRAMIWLRLASPAGRRAPLRLSPFLFRGVGLRFSNACSFTSLRSTQLMQIDACRSSRCISKPVTSPRSPIPDTLAGAEWGRDGVIANRVLGAVTSLNIG